MTDDEWAASDEAKRAEASRAMEVSLEELKRLNAMSLEEFEEWWRRWTAQQE